MNGRKRPLEDVLYLKSAEHYVEVVLHDARELVRTSLKDLIEEFSHEHGVQPHRSYWVSRDAIVGLNRIKGAQFLVLRNGEEIPVARSKRGHVSNWVKSTLLDTAS
ncbi:LytTR family transcriptional regulator [Rhodobacteraceae bacterium D3-12]|nr:LytTR family transcriptional regulator [Rhodobacteraceae bacterium D3-12]